MGRPLLFHRCVDQVILRCVLEVNFECILDHCHLSPYGGHFRTGKTSPKILDSSFY